MCVREEGRDVIESGLERRGRGFDEGGEVGVGEEVLGAAGGNVECTVADDRFAECECVSLCTAPHCTWTSYI